MAGRGVTKAKILTAASALFGDLGFEAVTTRGVAARAEVNQALVFYHFGSKEALFAAVLADHGAFLADALDRALAPDGPARARIHTAVDVLLDVFEVRPGFARILQQQLAGKASEHDAVQQALQPLATWTQAVLAELAPGDAPAVAPSMFFLSGLNVVLGYTTAAPLFVADAHSDDVRAAHRAHLHWLVDAVVPRLRSERLTGGSAAAFVGDGRRSEEYLR